MPKKMLVTKGKDYFPKQEYLIKDISKDFHTKYGFIKSEQLKKKQGKVLTNMNKEYLIFEPNFLDLYRRIRRMPQMIPLKDIGAIIAYTGVNKKSAVVDAGSGSGGIACFLANIVKEVSTYEIDEKNFELVKENIKALGLKNVKAKKKDIYEGIEEKNVDLIMLDLAEPWKVLESASKALKTGGWLVYYSLTIPQMHQFVNEVNKNDNFMVEKSIETTEREWRMEKSVRPERTVIPSGFLCFVRKIK
jgi:tRNA (adenine57-N1/adenine58-N1)-methyltransferase